MRIKLITIAIHALIWWGCIFILAPAPLGLGQFELAVFNPDDTLPFFLYGALLNAVMFYTYAHMALPRYLRRPSFSYFILINVFYLAGFTFAESLMDYYYMKHIYLEAQMSRNWTSFREWLETNLVITGSFMLVANFYGFTFGWFQSQQQQQALEQARLQAELSALKHQINPHFLFNILNGLYGLAFRNDDDETAEGIAKLSQLMRYMLYESNDSRVLLDKEIAHLENYIDLQKLRLDERTLISFTVEGQTGGRMIVPMVLIPFVENAFKHGVSAVHPSPIRIALRVEREVLRFEVQNSIHRSTPATAAPEGGIGLQNVQKRLDLLYKDAYNLLIDESDGLYTVHLTLTLL
ncbi:MAG: sensor histidine kinase [Bacteroidia bacterium]